MVKYSRNDLNDLLGKVHTISYTLHIHNNLLDMSCIKNEKNERQLQNSITKAMANARRKTKQNTNG